MNSLQRRGAEDAEFPQRELTEKIIGGAIEVHRCLGPGLLESIYQRALAQELKDIGLSVALEVPIPVTYKGVDLGAALRADMLIDQAVIVEVKSVQAIEDIHAAQLLSYLRLTGLVAGLVINFNVAALRLGIRRVSNSLRPSASSAALR